MFGVLLLGLLIGLQHAVEADHLAAVASLTTRGKNLRDAARLGSAWGVGHSLTLLMFGGGVLLIGGAIDPQFTLWLEVAVGLMLIALGIDVLLRLIRRRIHFHRHHHGDREHFHAHSHAATGNHANDPHKHQHKKQLPMRSMLVGMMHGMAGSAALIVFALGSVQSMWQGFAYILMFSIGSIVGMTLLAVAISLPLRWSATSLTWAHNSLTALLGVVTLTLGTLLLQQTGSELLSLNGI